MVKVMKNPARRKVGDKFRVLHPVKRTDFPDEVFDLKDAELADMRVKRLFPPKGQPGGVDGGKFGDLVLADDYKTATAKVAKTETPAKAAEK